MPNMIGREPWQVPTNAHLGSMAYQSKEGINVDMLAIGGRDIAGPEGAKLVGVQASGSSIIRELIAKLFDQGVNVLDYGADPTGVFDSLAPFNLAIAQKRPVYVPAGDFRLSATLSKTLGAGEDFILYGDGPETSRLFYDAAVKRGISIAYSTDVGGQSQGNKRAIRICGLDLEAAGLNADSAIRIINTPPANQVNETEVAVSLERLRINGSTNTAYWSKGIDLLNVTFPTIRDIEIQDPTKTTIGMSFETSGTTYAGVEYYIDNYRANGPAIAIQVRGKCEGVYVSRLVAVGGTNGIDWVATPPAGGGKKPLLSLLGSHFNLSGTAVKGVDVAQFICVGNLVYLTNSNAVAATGFDFSASLTTSSENHVLRANTIIGLGDRTGSLSTGVKLGANTYGCSIDITADNLGTGVSAAAQGRHNIAATALITNCNTRTSGFFATGLAGSNGAGTANVDSSLQMEFVGSDRYEVDTNRMQYKAGTLTFQATAASQNYDFPLERPFRTDTTFLMACWGDVPNAGAALIARTADSTAGALRFAFTGLTVGSTYRVNWIAHGY